MPPPRDACVIGVDTHRDTHTAAILDERGGLVLHLTVSANQAGYRRLLRTAREHAPGERLWAIEGTGSFGAGLTTALHAAGEQVTEIDHPRRPARRNGAKTDELDAIRAAREALTREHLTHPRQRGDREALRVLLTTREGAMRARTKAICQLKALVVNAPDALRQRLNGCSTTDLLRVCAHLRRLARGDAEQNGTRLALRTVARRVLALQAEATLLERELARLVRQTAAFLLEERGVGPVTAAQLLCSWSFAGRLRSEAAFAALAGVAPIPASSGQVTRYRLNRAGDRQLNRALHTVVLSRLLHDAETRAYVARRTAEGKSSREIQRCLKRHLARRLFKLLERGGPVGASSLGAAA